MTVTVPEHYLPAAAKGLVFDLDGTLLHTMHHHWAAWQQVSSECGLTITIEQFHGMAGMPSTAIFERLCSEQGVTIEDLPAALQRKTELYMQLAGETTVIESVLQIAHAAKARGLPVAVATGGNRKQVTKSMATAQLADYFHAVVTCDDITPGNGKPHPETFLRAAQLIGVEPQDCVGYEDAPLGMQAIQAAGFLLAVDVTKMPGYPAIH